MILYVSFGSKVKPRTFGCVAMCSVVLFILRSKLLLFSAGFCFVQANTLCRHGCMYLLAALVLVCVDYVICVGHDLKWFDGWW